MRMLRSFVLISTLVGSLLAAPAALAAGRAPAGNGPFSLTGQQDITITNFVCEDATITDVVVAPGGLPAWVIGDPDRMYVLASISGAGTATSPSGSTSYEFEQSYGRKSGLGGSTTCSMDYTMAYGDVIDSGVMVVDIVRIW